MKFREWDPGTRGAKGISDYHYGCLEAIRKGSEITDPIEIRGDLGKKKENWELWDLGVYWELTLGVVSSKFGR